MIMIIIIIILKISMTDWFKEEKKLGKDKSK